MRSKQRERGGFTLVEILIVVVILGVLAAMVIPQMSSATDEARIGAAIANRNAIHSAILSYFKDHAEYPQTLDPDWFVNKRLPANPFGQAWEGDPVQEFSSNDLSRRIPEYKIINPSLNYGKPFWYHPRTGDIYLRVPDQGNDAETLALFNRINGLDLTSITQDMP
ncbi:type II secretion system protein [Mucisphaera calidilacus]|uniref:Type II secretion system protein G n=1 Tax=Mucisphaera calidilacus TaxID=2527982 RepID=A0A518BYL3_9BACT|nr:type II secretion system protein [Mucisphaera calidilacus]QDU72063.1 Type II secretion system protein G precursor [Mucisphaera calidilacus]